jgi:hypothetical protein
MSSPSEAAALGLCTHSGWTVAVAVAGSPQKPAVLERRRIDYADAAVPGSRQPYHAAQALDLQSAETWIRECRSSATLLATSGVGDMAAQIRHRGFTLGSAGILFGSNRPLPELAAILRSHALIHTAEGEFFREVLVRASEQCSLRVTRVKEREVWDRGAGKFGLVSADLQGRIGGLGKSLGPPWRRDERLASLAGWIALAESK